MKMREKKSIFASLVIGFLTVVLLLSSSVHAVDLNQQSETEISGELYELDKDSHYEVSAGTSVETNAANAYGSFRIGGDVVAVDSKKGIPSYQVSEGDLSFFYNYSDTLLRADEDSWHLVDDKTNEVADTELDSDIMKGAIIVQTSKDRKTWITEKTICDAFSNTPVRTSPIYEATDIQMLNGCYYRMIVAYKLGKRTEDSNFLFINTDKYEYKKCAEVYEFYVYSENGPEDSVDLTQSYNLGSKVRSDCFDGYFGESVIEKDDIHYGWDLGNFFVSGYTDRVADADGNTVFLKNVGDKVTLWFRLNQNINGLNNDEDLKITADAEGYDQYFETPKMNFGRGALIIRYTDHNNVKAEPVIYTNYLEANASVGADTRVQLFEEGDYEVALDYQVTSDELIDKVGHYRIFFKFSVRNGNCMVYPFDVSTGSELTQSSMTESGFRLDLAQSRYLKINLKRATLKDSADGLVEDTRFNGPARDGAEYTDEGIYTITVSNEYTGQFTTKKIYVGTNNILRAHITTGLEIPEINHLVADGATILEDGTIQLANEVLDGSELIPNGATMMTTDHEAADNSDTQSEKTGSAPILLIAAIVIVVLVAITILWIRKKQKPVEEHTVGGAREGGAK